MNTTNYRLPLMNFNDIYILETHIPIGNKISILLTYINNDFFR